MQDYTPKHSDNTTPAIKFDRKKIINYATLAVAAALIIALIITLCVVFFGGREEYNDFKNNNTVSSALPANPIDFEAVKEKYPDACAWIQVDGIDVIDYPIVQSAIGVDDNFYLDHNIDGEKDRYGAIYIQRLNHKDFNDRNTLIYGHNMLNGTMFGQLKKFRNRTFFEENRNIYVYTPGHILKYEIISAFIYDDRHIMNSFNFNIENECKEFFDECINPTTHTKQVLEGAELTTRDKIITLSTCTSNDSQRYLVVGKLISDTETQK